MRKIVVRSLMILALCGAFVAPSRADDSTERLAAAKELLSAMHTSDTFKQIFPSLTTQIRSVIVAANPKAGKDYDEIAPRIESKVFRRLDEILDQIAAIYAKSFTALELHDIAAFFKTSTGAKLVSLQSQIAQSTLQLGAAWGQKIAAELQEEIKTELRKRGHQI